MARAKNSLKRMTIAAAGAMGGPEGPVAQLDRAAPPKWRVRGRKKMERHTLRKKAALRDPCSEPYEGENQAPWLNWIEQPPPKGQVAGSNPAGVTTFHSYIRCLRDPCARILQLLAGFSCGFRCGIERIPYKTRTIGPVWL